MTTLYQIAPAAPPRKAPFCLILLAAKRLARNGARQIAVVLATGFALAVAGLFFAAISALHLWEARWKPRT
jgi:cell division protein FtsX